jgi:hypothetical protein
MKIFKVSATARDRIYGITSDEGLYALDGIYQYCIFYIEAKCANDALWFVAENIEFPLHMYDPEIEISVQ